MPILGIIASSKLTSVPGDFESIATVNGTGSNATIVFNSIPSTYKHLQIHALFKGTAASTNTQGMLVMQFNSDTGSNTNYSSFQVVGQGAGASQVQVMTRTGLSGMFNDSSMYYQSLCSATNTGSAMATAIIDINDYANTSYNKNAGFLFGKEIGNNDGNSRCMLASGAWASTAAITSITFTIYDESMVATNFTSTSQFALYGIKG